MEKHDILAVAVTGQIDPSTIARYLRGISVRDLSRRRIEGAMRSLGLERFIVPASNPSDDTQPAGAR